MRDLAQELRLALLVRQQPPHVVAVRLRLQQRDEMDARPQLLPDELTTFQEGHKSADIALSECEVWSRRWCALKAKRHGKDLLLLPDPLAHAVPAVGHDADDGGHVVRGAEAAEGQVALPRRVRDGTCAGRRQAQAG